MFFQLKIAHKLFLVLFLCGLAMVVAMGLVSRWNLARGFLGYINETEARKLASLIPALEAEYSETGSWDAMRLYPRRWQHLMRLWIESDDQVESRLGSLPDDYRSDRRPRGRRANRPGRRETAGRRGPSDRPFRGPSNARQDDEELNDHRSSPRTAREGEEEWNDRGAGPRKARPRPARRPRHGPAGRPSGGPRGGDGPDTMGLGPRVVLLDAERQVVKSVPGKLLPKQLQAIRVGDEIVGWVGIRPRTELSATEDLLFIQRQNRNFLFFAIGLLLLALGLSVILARNLVRPIQRLAKATAALSRGKFITRVELHGRDEIHDLCRDFNNLAHTLEKNEEIRRAWVSDISHELRTPLAILRGELEALQDGVRILDRESLNSLHTEVLCLGKLVEDLYQLSLADIGALDYKKIRVDPIEVFRRAANAFEHRFSERGLSLNKAELDEKQAKMFADPERLFQLFSNILENSVRYTQSGGETRLGVVTNASELRFIIEDSEPGVSEEACEQLFDRFFRVERSRNRESGGAGLGLAMCKKIVVAHEGTIFAEPSPLGGLKVVIQLPCIK